MLSMRLKRTSILSPLPMSISEVLCREPVHGNKQYVQVHVGSAGAYVGSGVQPTFPYRGSRYLRFVNIEECLLN